MITYKHTILQHKLYNSALTRADLIDLNFNQILTSHQPTFEILKTKIYKVGNRILFSRLTVVNNKIDLNDLNLSLDSFKIKYKKLMLLMPLDLLWFQIMHLVLGNCPNFNKYIKLFCSFYKIINISKCKIILFEIHSFKLFYSGRNSPIMSKWFKYWQIWQFWGIFDRYLTKN